MLNFSSFSTIVGKSLFYYTVAGYVFQTSDCCITMIKLYFHDILNTDFAQLLLFCDIHYKQFIWFFLREKTHKT